MLTLKFKQSKSKRYKEAYQKAIFFDTYDQIDGMNVIEFSLKEIIQKWEWFNELYWIVLDWKGTTVTYENIEYYSHTDKTKIFYAIQEIHTNWINYTTTKLVTTYQRISPKSKLLDIDADELSEEQINHLIDVMMEKKKASDCYNEKMKKIERMIKEYV